jgi:hypothetical protein
VRQTDTPCLERGPLLLTRARAAQEDRPGATRLSADQQVRLDTPRMTVRQAHITGASTHSAG